MEEFKGVQSNSVGRVFLYPPDKDGDIEIESYRLGEHGISLYLEVDDLVAYLRGLGYTVEKPGEKPTLYWIRHDSGAHLAETPEESFMDAPYSAWARLNRASSYGHFGAGARRGVYDVPFAEAVRQIVAWAEADGFIVPPIPADILELMKET